MSVLEISDRKKYEDLWDKHRMSFLQSWEWGEIKKPEWKPLRLMVGDLPVQILTRKISLTNIKFGYIPRGLDINYWTKEQIGELHLYLKANRFAFLLTELPNENILKNTELLFKFDGGIFFSGKSTQPQYTNRIDLNQTYEEIFSGFSESYRRKVRKALKEGLEIEVCKEGSDGLDRFYEVMKWIISNTKFVAHGKEYFEKVWDKLSKSGMAKIYIVKKDKIDYGSIFVVEDQSGIYELYGGVNEFGKRTNAAVFLRDAVIHDYAGRSLEYYDLWGVARILENGEFDKKDELFGVSVFKSGFGGRNVIFFPQIANVFNLPSYIIYRFGLTLNNLKIRLSKLF